MPDFDFRQKLQSCFRDPRLVRLADTGTDQVARHANWWDFEEPLPVVLASLSGLIGGRCFYDVGANTGFYSVLVAKVQPRATVRAFEPVASIATVCRGNLDRNGVDATIEPYALSDHDGSASLYFPPDDHGLIETSASLDEGFNRRNARAETVPIRRLDTVVRERGDRVGLMKIDVEGHEDAVLTGGLDVLESQQPLLVIEVLPKANRDGLNRLIATRGYRPIALRKGLVFEPREHVHFLQDGWNWLLVPERRFGEVWEIVQRARDDFQAVRAAGLWNRLVRWWAGRRGGGE